jgi:guanylate kinase
LSISYTTRTLRAGEVNGQDYHFVSEDRFMHLRAAGALAEWAKVHGFLYGTARSPLDEALTHGHDLLLDIDVQGARQLKASYAEAVSIFVLPPSWQELEGRLRGRATDHEEVISRRLQRAREEAGELFSYDYWLVNDKVEGAVAVLRGIIMAERARVSRLMQAHTTAVLFTSPTTQGRKMV